MAKLTTHVQGESCLRESSGMRVRHLLACFTIALAFGAPALADTYFQFDRMWPTLQQPWYFYDPSAISVDNLGNVYVSELTNHRVQKFNSDGVFVAKWGTEGSDDGQFNRPSGVAVNSDREVIVADRLNHRIQKFTSDGEYLTQWGEFGNGDGQFNSPYAVAVDGVGTVYVADTGNGRIQKFNSDGTFLEKFGEINAYGLAVNDIGNIYITEATAHVQSFNSDGTLLAMWGGPGSGEGQFWDPYGVAVDKERDIYVADKRNHRVQKFTSDGVFVLAWGSRGNGDGQFIYPEGLVVDGTGNVCVADRYNHRVQKFTSEGEFLGKWNSAGIGIGQFDHPQGAVVDSLGCAYVADMLNHRIEKFNNVGGFVTLWGDQGSGDGQFLYPEDVAVDNVDNIYVADTNNQRIQKFASSGIFIGKWGSPGDGEGQFSSPSSIALDSEDNVYVTDYGNNCVQKFNSNGVFVMRWGSCGDGDGQFCSPDGVAVDSEDNIYVSANDRIQKFSSDGIFLTKWGSYGTGNGQFNHPYGVAVDGSNYVYVVDSLNQRIQRFSSNGLFVDQFGLLGNDPASFTYPRGIATSTMGGVVRIYVVDTYNHRLQVFKETLQSPSTKAIIVAAGGAFPGNNLWDATQLCANFAYRTLTYQGFSKDRVQYLSSDLDLDLDSNGMADDVDGDATNANLQSAVMAWALTGDTEDLVVYLVDHGGDSVFRMSGTETLSASNLDSWLDSLQDGIGTDITGTLTVVYEACESGSFQATLAPTSGQQRIILTSTSPNESAYFLSQGSVSFSMFFWTHVFNGATVLEAFELATQGMGQAIDLQTPLIVDTPGNNTLAAATYIGNGTQIIGAAPVIAAQTAPHAISGTSTDTIWADPVTDADGIARVWVVVQPPDFVPTSTTNPVQDLPNFDLPPVGGNRYEATWPGFTSTGLYQLAIYARDRIGNVSSPVLTTVSVDSPLRRKAIICIGGTQSHPQWAAFEYAAGRAYSALKAQGYTDGDIAFRSPVTFNAGVDGAPSLSNVQYTLTTWGTLDTYDLVLYLVGPGSSGSFTVGTSEFLDPVTLDGWLDILQTTIPGKVTVVIESDYSGTFIPGLVPPVGKPRIVCTSAGDEVSRLGVGGSVSFSNYFWTGIRDGEKVRSAHQDARNAMRFTGGGQIAVINDNGNTVGNEKLDGLIAKDYTIGMGKRTAGDAPYIDEASVGADPDSLSGGTSSTIWAENVTTTGTIDAVTATILPPGYAEGDALTEVPLTWSVGNARYEATYNGFSVFGTYEIAIVARDSEGQVSAPAIVTLIQEDGPDSYEPDDGFGSASWFALDGPSQTHNFHTDLNEDWVKFFAHAGDVVAIETFALGTACDTLITLYRGDALTYVDESDDDSPNETWASYLEFTASATEYYYLKIEFSLLADPPRFGPDTEYSLRIFRPIGACIQSGTLRVYVHEGSVSGAALSGATVSVAEVANLGFPQEASSGVGGLASFGFSKEGSHRIAVSLTGYTMAAQPDVALNCGESLDVDTVMAPNASVSPVLQVTPGGWEFGQVAVGDYIEKVFTLSNTGGETLAGSASAASPFSIVSGGSYSLGVGQSTNVAIRFTPGAAQGYNGEAAFTGGGGKTVALSGTGYNAAGGVIGDVNTDGSIDAFDGTLINLYILTGYDLETLNAQLQGLGLNPMVAALADVDRTGGTTSRDGALINAQLLMGKTALNGYLSTRSPALPISHAGEPLP